MENEWLEWWCWFLSRLNGWRGSCTWKRRDDRRRWHLIFFHYPYSPFLTILMEKMRWQQEVKFNLLLLPFLILFSIVLISPLFLVLKSIVIFSSLFLFLVLVLHDLLFCRHPGSNHQHQELQGGIPVQGMTVLNQNPSTLKPDSEYYRQESAIEMFKAFSTVDKKTQAPARDSSGQRESYLFDERLTP